MENSAKNTEAMKVYYVAIISQHGQKMRIVNDSGCPIMPASYFATRFEGFMTIVNNIIPRVTAGTKIDIHGLACWATSDDNMSREVFARYFKPNEMD